MSTDSMCDDSACTQSAFSGFTAPFAPRRFRASGCTAGAMEEVLPAFEPSLRTSTKHEPPQHRPDSSQAGGLGVFTGVFSLRWCLGLGLGLGLGRGLPLLRRSLRRRQRLLRRYPEGAPRPAPAPRAPRERAERPPGAGCLGPGLAAWGGGSPAAVRSPAPGSPPGPCAPSAASPPVWLWACRVSVWCGGRPVVLSEHGESRGRGIFARSRLAALPPPIYSFIPSHLHHLKTSDSLHPVECFRRVDSGGECGAPRGRGAGMHGVRGASRDVLARGPGVSPDICP